MAEYKNEGVNEAGIEDSLEVRVKGPGAEWAWRDEMLANAEAKEDVELEDLKGPGSQWETDENGEYVNRD